MASAEVTIKNGNSIISESKYSSSYDVAIGEETLIGKVCFYSNEVIEFSSYQSKTIQHVVQQIGYFLEQQIQKFESEQKDFYKKILDRLPTDVAVFDKNHKYLYLNPAAIQNEELREFIIGKDDFEYAKHTNRNPRFAQDRRDRFTTAAKTKSVIEWID